MEIKINMYFSAKVILLLCLVTNGLCRKWKAANLHSEDSKPQSSLVAKDPANYTSKECILLNKIPEKEIYKLQIRGQIIKFSDIPDDDTCGGSIKYFELFALDEIKVDKDFIKSGKVVQLVAIAPKLKVIGEITINLNGYNAQNHTAKAKDGRFGIPGNAGLAGLPGGPGGIFYAFANDIENVDSLIISANGGSGGRGQDGGNGGIGYDGTPPDVKKLPKIAGFVDGWSNCEAPRKVCNYTGADGYPGGNGGDGGVGGKGGKGGTIFLHELNKNSKKMEQQVADGPEGFQGRGGKGGKGGKNGGYVAIPCCGPNRTGFQPSSDSKIRWGSEFAPSGENGTDGASSKNLEEPEKFLGYVEFSSVVDDYKQFLRSHWNDESRNGKLADFYIKLIDSKEINDWYGTQGLLDELKDSGEKHLLMKYIDVRSYEDEIESKIKEASNFIKSQIRVEIDEIDDGLKDGVYQLINETMVLKEKALKRREALQSGIYHQYLKTAIKTGVTGATVLIPGGQLLAPSALTAFQVGESFSRWNETKLYEVRIPKAVRKEYKDVLGLDSAYNKSELKLIDEEVYVLNQEQKKPERSNLRKMLPDQVNNVFSIFNNKKQVPNSNENNARINGENERNFGSEIFNNLKTLSNPLNLNVDTLYPAGDEKDKIKELRDEIEKLDSDMEYLRVYQDEIFSIFIPLLERMKDDLPTEKGLSLQSTAALDVSEWKVKTSIKKVRRFLKKFVEGFEVAEDINLLMERLDETIGTLINVYGRIESYHREKKLLTYVAKTMVNFTFYLKEVKNLNKSF